MEIRPILSALLRSKTGAILIAAQIALTLAIVCNALFVVNQRLESAARPSGAMESTVFQLLLSPLGDIDPQEVFAMQQADIDALRSVPGVVAAAWTNQAPMAQSGWGFALGTDPQDPQSFFGAAAYFSPESLVDALGLKLVEGRDFRPDEVLQVDPRSGVVHGEVILVTRAVAERLFPGESAVGKSLFVYGQAGPQPSTIVGVVDTLMSPFAQLNPDAYLSFIMPVRFGGGFTNYLVRIDRPDAMASAQRDAEKALLVLRNDRVLGFNRSLTEVRNTRYRAQRSLATTLIAVTVGLLLVTGSGIVGMASLWVMQRRKQIGTRRALGARRLDILRYFLTENFLNASAGVAIGLALTVALNDLLVRELSMPRLPVEYFIGGAVAMWLLGLLAVLGPAWRAASVPPAVATRSV